MRLNWLVNTFSTVCAAVCLAACKQPGLEVQIPQAGASEAEAAVHRAPDAGQLLPGPLALSRSTSASLANTLAFGSQAAADLPAARVADNGFARSFSTGAGGELSSAAYCIYSFSPSSPVDTPVVAVGWLSELPSAGEAWLGLANWPANRWDWFPASTELVSVPNFSDFRDADGRVLAAVLLFPTSGQAAAATLGWLSLGGYPAQAGALCWGEPLEIAASGEITTAFNNAQPVLRTRDQSKLFIGYRADDGLHLARLEAGTVSADNIVSTLPNAAGLTIDERPGEPEELWIAYTYPGGVVLRSSNNQGASFSAETDQPGSGVLPAAVSLSFGDDGSGYALWHAGATVSQVMYSTLPIGSSAWIDGAVLETAFSPSAFACVWARSGPALATWRSDTVAGPDQSWAIRFTEHNGSGWGSISTIGGATQNYDPSVVRLSDASIALACFEIDQVIHVSTASSSSAPFAELYSPLDFGRFPGLRANSAGVIALTYEYQAEQGDNHDNSIKECGLSVSYDGGASWVHRACDPALLGATEHIYSHCWLSEPSGFNAGILDFIWIDASSTPQKLYLQTAEVVQF